MSQTQVENIFKAEIEAFRQLQEHPELAKNSTDMARALAIALILKNLAVVDYTEIARKVRRATNLPFDEVEALKLHQEVRQKLDL